MAYVKGPAVSLYESWYVRRVGQMDSLFEIGYVTRQLAILIQELIRLGQLASMYES